MIKSIRVRLFIIISSLSIFFILFSIFLNSQYLGKYYVAQKKHNLYETKERINRIYNGQPETISFLLEKLERNTGMNIFILNNNFDFKYSTIGGMNRLGQGMMPRPFQRMPFVRDIEEGLLSISKGESVYDIITDPRLSTQFLVMSSELNNGDFLILSTPLSAINESAEIASRFFLFTGLITIFLGGIIAFVLSKRFTKPILELNSLAQRMSKLDFSMRYLHKSNDEIGQLGNSINSLSDQLDKAITDLQEANQKLMEDIQRERMIDQMRKEFVSSVSHELKTPLALIQGYAEGLKLNINEDEESKDFYCDVIMDESAKMDRLVKDLLDLSQIESGYFKLERTDFYINDLVEYVIEKYKPILAEKDIKLKTETKDILVNGDIGRIEQVLVNYLNNAINHVDENKVIEIMVDQISDKVRLEIFNSGKNIPQESMDEIWKSFYKVDKARTRSYGGTGLGLSVVRAIQELHNNKFGAQNRPKGVVFWFEIDMVQN